MEPYLREGDHVLTANWTGFCEKDVVVFKSGGMYLVKRVDKIDGNNVFASGDNKKFSKKLGPISKNKIVGKVILKY